MGYNFDKRIDLNNKEETSGWPPEGHQDIGFQDGWGLGKNPSDLYLKCQKWEKVEIKKIEDLAAAEAVGIGKYLLKSISKEIGVDAEPSNLYCLGCVLGVWKFVIVVDNYTCIWKFDLPVGTINISEIKKIQNITKGNQNEYL